MARPRLLDLFCGAGGAGMGYHRAGFDVVGVDVKPQPRYPFEFHQADALTFPLDGFDAIHASPPCQAYSSLRHLTPHIERPDLIAATRERLVGAGAPYVIENVEGAPLGEGTQLIMLCGTMFRLQTPDGRAEIRRHRLFELGGFTIALRPACQHGSPATISVTGDQAHSPAARHEVRKARERRKVLTVVGHTPVDNTGRRGVLSIGGGKAMTGGLRASQSLAKRRALSVTGNTPQINVVRNTVRETFSVEDARAAMGIDWMPMKSLSQAIPPAYTEFIGRELLAAIRAEGAA